MSIGSVPGLLPPLVTAPSVSSYPDEQLELRHFSADEFQQIIDAGVLSPEHIELVDGSIVSRTPGADDEHEYRKWSVDEYERLIDVGVLKESEPVELLEGWIVQKMSRNTPHDTALDKTEDAVRAVLPPGWRLRSQKAIRTGTSEPEPDCAIVAGDADSYFVSPPTPADIAFVIEVASRSLATDRTNKGYLYGLAQIPIYWIVNVRNRQVEVYTDPTGVVELPEAPGYRTRQVFQQADIVPVVIRGQVVGQIPVASLLPRA